MAEDSGTPARAVVADAAEISLIASLLASPWQHEHIKDWLRPEDFSLYTAITDVAEQEQPIDGVTVMCEVDPLSRTPWCPRKRVNFTLEGSSVWVGRLTVPSPLSRPKAPTAMAPGLSRG